MQPAADDIGGIVPEEGRRDQSVGLVAFDADTGSEYGASYGNTSLLGTHGAAPLTASTPTLTPAPMPTVDPDILERPPQGPGAEIGNTYPYTLYVHCGVRDAHFDGRVWMADPMLGNYNPPPGWTSDDSRGTIELVRDDLAIFKSVSGRTIEFIPWPSDVEWTPCF